MTAKRRHHGIDGHLAIGNCCREPEGCQDTAPRRGHRQSLLPDEACDSIRDGAIPVVDVRRRVRCPGCRVGRVIGHGPFRPVGIHAIGGRQPLAYGGRRARRARKQRASVRGGTCLKARTRETLRGADGTGARARASSTVHSHPARGSAAHSDASRSRTTGADPTRSERTAATRDVPSRPTASSSIVSTGATSGTHSTRAQA